MAEPFSELDPTGAKTTMMVAVPYPGTQIERRTPAK
jgi:hypothetical protein